MDEAVAVAICHRRNVIALLASIIQLQQKQQIQHHRRLRSRQWLQRRDTCNSVLTMLFEELG